MSDALISSLDTGSSYMLGAGYCSPPLDILDDCDHVDYSFSNGGSVGGGGGPIHSSMSMTGAAGECADRLNSLAILSCNDDTRSPSDSSSPPLSATMAPTTTVRSRPSQRGKPRPPKAGAAPGSTAASAASASRAVIQCSICSKTFNNSSALAKHKLIHSDERKYACSLCSKAFKRQDHLNGHMMTHYSKKPYECKFTGCDKSYCDARSLRRHLENHHQQLLAETGSLANSDSGTQTPVSAPPDGSRDRNYFDFDLPPFVPSSGSPGSGTLGNSQMLGEGHSPSIGQWPPGFNPFDEPKPVKCTVCDRRFRNLPALNGHMRLHGGYMKKEGTEMPGRPDEEAGNVKQPTRTHITKRSASSSHIYLSPGLTGSADGEPPGLVAIKTEIDIGISSNQFVIYGEPIGDLNHNQTMTGSRTNLFDHTWLDGKAVNSDDQPVTIKTEPMSENGGGGTGNMRQVTFDCQPPCDLDLPRFVRTADPFFGSALSMESSQNVMAMDDGQNACIGGGNAVGTGTCVDMLTSDVVASGGTMKENVHVLLDDSLPDFGFPLDHQPPATLMTSHSMPVLPVYAGADMKSPAMVCDGAGGGTPTHLYASAKNRTLAENYQNSGSGSANSLPGMVSGDAYTVGCGATNVAAATESCRTPGGYAAYFQMAPRPDQTESNEFQFPVKVEMPDVGFPAQPARVDGYYGTPISTPKTPTMYGAKAAVPPPTVPLVHRTPRTPYTPSTPSRASQFQFPAITEGSIASFPHRYPKSAAVYHPYGPPAAAPPPMSPVASPLVYGGATAVQRNAAIFAQQLERQKFRAEVAHAQHEIEQHLQQLQQEDKLKQQQQSMLFQFDQQLYGTTGTTRKLQHSSEVTSCQQPLHSLDSTVEDDVMQILFSDHTHTTVRDHAAGNSTMMDITGVGARSGSEENPLRNSAVFSAGLMCDPAVGISVADAKKPVKRKQKPEPLVIPPDVSNFAGLGPATTGGWDQRRMCQQQRHDGPPPPAYPAMLSPACGGVTANRQQWLARDVEPRSAPPFQWSTAATSFSAFDADSLLADLPP